RDPRSGDGLTGDRPAFQPEPGERRDAPHGDARRGADAALRSRSPAGRRPARQWYELTCSGSGSCMNFACELQLAGRLLVRDWRAGEVTLIAAAIVIAVAAVTTIGFFTDRVQRALRVEASRLLGADPAIGDSRPIAREWKAEARRRGLTAVTVARFPSMVLRGERNMLSDVKVVEAGFPARGEVRIAERL